MSYQIEITPAAGHWRIMYKVNDEQIVVLILHVRRKEDTDYPSV